MLYLIEIKDIHFSHGNTISIYYRYSYKTSILISDCQISYKS
ncbi:hypothetical protein AB54_4014 [Escherichia coli 2-011-08_S1_C3]|nr:hypothetical protein AB54_4014 [Escherichia coli 2-011-08_S1_C3]